MLWQRTLGDESEATKFRRPRRRISSARWELRIRNTLRWKSLKIKCLCIFGWVIEMKIIKLRINCLDRKTNPKIVDLFWIKKILQPQKHLVSIKHWLFYITLGCFFQNNFDVKFNRRSYKQYKHCSRCFLLVFTFDFEKAKRVRNE